jgi:hypothetical protein
MSIRRTHRIDPITINGIRVVQVIIDPHYEIKHSDHIDDALILRLVQKLNGRFELPESISGVYSYFSTLIEHKARQYRLVWLLENNALYVGVVNAFRDRRKD